MSVIAELQEQGFNPEDQCYCGCRGEAREGKYFAHSHDPKFPHALLRELRGNQDVSQAIQELSGATPDGHIPDDHQETATLNDELRHYWGFRPNGQCYSGCGQPTGSYFTTKCGSSTFTANLLRILHGNQQVWQAIQQLAKG